MVHFKKLNIHEICKRPLYPYANYEFYQLTVAMVSNFEFGD